MADPILAQERFVPEDTVLTADTPDKTATFFDGKNFWVASSESILKVVEFWGPYVDLDNTSNTRWQEPEVDLVTIPLLGPKVRVIKTIQPVLFRGSNGGMYVKVSDVPSTVTYEEVPATISHFKDAGDFVKLYAKLNEDDIGFTKILYSKIDYEPVSVELTRDWLIELGQLVLPEQLPDENGVLYTPESPITRGGDYWWAVGPTVLGQFGDDRQFLYSYTQSVAIGAPLVYHSRVAIPGRKQFEPRSLAAAYGKMWVTGFNTSSIHGYDLVTGAFFTSVGINRDVSGVYSEAGKLYTLSRNGLVHEVSAALNVVPVGGQSYWDDLVEDTALPKRKWCDLGSVYWRVSADQKSIEKVDKATNLVTKYRVFDDDPEDDPPADEEFDEDKKVIFVAGSPVMTYEYFDGTAFQTVEVPEHVMVGCFDGTDYKTETFRLPGFYRGIAKKTASGYTAVSIGPLSYKGDNC